MIEIVHEIRKGIIAQLQGNVTYNSQDVNVYNSTPNNVSKPYIRVYTIEQTEDIFNGSSYIIDALIRIDVITSFDADTGGELQANQIMSQVLNLTRTRSSDYIDLSAYSAHLYSVTNDGVRYIENYDEDQTYYIGNLDLRYKVELL